MAKEDENIGENVSENELESNSHIKKCGSCSKPVEKCGTCNKPVNKESLRNDRTLHMMFDRLESLINATGFTKQSDKRKVKNDLLKIMDYIF